jgi:ATP-binding cassette subfamily C protein
VILDEATCHLDPVAEAQAERAFTERHGTLVVIAHRISSAMRAHRILVMDGADTVLGNHRDLLTSNSLYADLVGYWDHTMTPARLTAASGSGQLGERNKPWEAGILAGCWSAPTAGRVECGGADGDCVGGWFGVDRCCCKSAPES